MRNEDSSSRLTIASATAPRPPARARPPGLAPSCRCTLFICALAGRCLSPALPPKPHAQHFCPCPAASDLIPQPRSFLALPTTSPKGKREFAPGKNADRPTPRCGRSRLKQRGSPPPHRPSHDFKNEGSRWTVASAHAPFAPHARSWQVCWVYARRQEEPGVGASKRSLYLFLPFCEAPCTLCPLQTD